MHVKRLGLDANQRKRIRDLNRLTEKDIRHLKNLQPLVEPKMGQVVDAFYDHVQKFPHLIEFLQRQGVRIDQLKKTNPRYITGFWDGEYDEAFFETRLAIGARHAMIGLDATDYSSMNSNYFESIIPMICAKYRWNPKALAEAVIAFVKLINMDTQIVISAYMEYGFVSQLADLIRETGELGTEVNRAASTIADGSEQSGHIVTEVAGVSQHLAISVSDQAASTEAAAKSVHNLTDSAKAVGTGSDKQMGALRSAEQAMSRVQDELNLIAQYANKWSEIGEKIQNMSRVTETVRTTAERVQEMEARSTEIGAIVKTIDDIAAQTNLLALNAAIEAARAGEQGRGFAVVAEEVRKLAVSSTEATKEITSLINAVQNGTQEAVSAMNATLIHVQEGVEVTEQAGNSLEQIANSTQGLVSVSANLSTAMSTLRTVAEKNVEAINEIVSESLAVNEAINSISSITERNSAAAEEVSASTEEMTAQVEELVAQAQQLKDLAEQSQAALHKGEAALAKVRKNDNLGGEASHLRAA